MGSSPLVSTRIAARPQQKKPPLCGFFRILKKFVPRRAAFGSPAEKGRFAMKKRWIAAAAAALVCVSSLCGCGEGVVDLTGSSSQSAVSEEPSSAVPETDVQDSLLGLEEFMIAQGYVSGTPSEMNGALIGANELGHRYVSGTITAEFYEYDLENLNETAETVRASVEANGTFEIVGQTVSNVYLSDSGKYLMIYTNANTDETNTALTQAAIAAFKSFKAE